MPRGNRTGPRGMGSMTGRAAGYCAGSRVPGFLNAAFGRGLGTGYGRGAGTAGAGFGGGRGRRNIFHATGRPGWVRDGGNVPAYGYPVPYGNSDPEIEKRALRSQADALQAEMDFIKKRLNEIETGTPAE